VYDRILYIDSDCLVVKDVQHLLHLRPSTPHRNHQITNDQDDDNDSDDKDGDGNTLQQPINQTQQQQQQPVRDPPGLIAAAPDLFPPDKFNAGVMVIAPSRHTFRDMMDRIHTTVSYDGGDTGFLNAYYPNWYSGDGEGKDEVEGGDDTLRRRLAFGYNAQRFMYDCTYAKQPKYWDVGVVGGGDTNATVGGAKDELYVIHYSSSSKPWENPSRSTSSSSSSSKEFLTQTDATNVSKTIKSSSALDQRWRKIYERSQTFAKNFEEEREWLKSQQASRKRAPIKPDTAVGGRGGGGGGNKRVSQAGSGGRKDTHTSVSKRFKDLRKDGVGVKEAMAMARSECGVGGGDDTDDPGAQVAAMFGMQI